ncbi:MAG: retroviral-like aspartic protease family protein [Candidatus Omnitrophica bacterium]|nr:retroviral-like aspartic protease family protein [Candidatus Omnitrophota bacterium]MBU4590103.1 retroviral-like aspartic protease family protein [Candidatus Omnitrophota bacterium]
MPIIILMIAAISLSGCVATRIAGKTMETTGKLAFVTAKTVGKVALGTAKFTGKGLKTAVNMARGKEVVPLDKKCNSYYVDAILNRRVKTKLILDTGCTDTQIAPDIARKLGIKTTSGEQVSCMLADGRTVTGRAVNIRELKVGRARVSNVRAIVLDDGKETGLLGMSFLNNFVFKVDPEKSELVLQKR